MTNILSISIKRFWISSLMILGYVVLWGQVDTAAIERQGEEHLRNARRLGKSFHQPDSIYYYLQSAKSSFLSTGNDSLLFFSNVNLIEWLNRYREYEEMYKLLQENSRIVPNDFHRMILYLDFCDYFSSIATSQLDSCLHYAMKARDLAIDLDNNIHYIVALHHMTNVYLETPSQIHLAPPLIEEVRARRNIDAETRGLAIVSDIDRSRYCIKTNQPDEAIQILQQYASMEDVDFEFLRWVNEFLEEAYVLKGDYQNAWAVNHRLLEIKDSIASTDMTQSINALRVEYNLKTREEELANERAISTLREKALSSQRKLLWLVIGVAILLVSISWYAWRLASQKAKSNEQLVRSQKELASMKNMLFSNITHELRTPLTIILGMTKKIKEENQTKEMITRNAQQILTMVNQILDLSKSEQGQLELVSDKHDVVKVIHSAVQQSQPLASIKDISLTYESNLASMMAYVDRGRIEQICSNLLSNAIKFTPNNGTVHVALEIDRKTMLLSVEDSGKGIGEEDVEHVFDRFYQSKENRSQGTGIGLALVRELVTLMKGTIKVSSQKGIGTKFSISLPLQLAPVT